MQNFWKCSSYYNWFWRSRKLFLHFCTEKKAAHPYKNLYLWLLTAAQFSGRIQYLFAKQCQKSTCADFLHVWALLLTPHMCLFLTLVRIILVGYSIVFFFVSHFKIFISQRNINKQKLFEFKTAVMWHWCWNIGSGMWHICGAYYRWCRKFHSTYPNNLINHSGRQRDNVKFFSVLYLFLAL